MVRLSIFVAVAAVVSLQGTNAEAKGSTSLYLLATQYRAAVDNLEKTVLGVRGIDRSDERLVDRLDDAAVKMRLAARNPRHLNRLFHQWQAVKKLHVEVEQKLFGKYTPNHDIVQAWNILTYQYVLFAEEYFYQIENPKHDGEVKRAPLRSARRDSYLPSPLITPRDITRLPSGAILLPAPR